MELVQTSYRILFEFTIAIEGVYGDINSLISIEPDNTTLSLLKNYRILTKYQYNTHVFLIETIPDGPLEETPKIELQPNEIFRFQLKFRDKATFEGTHLSSYDWTDNVLFVSNEINHIDGSDLLLSAGINPYNNADDYSPGFLVSSGTNFFKAIQASSNSNPHPVTDTDFWLPLNDGTTISQADLQLRSSLSWATDLDTIIAIEIHHAATVNASYQLLDTNDICREVNYKIKILKHN